MVTVPELAAKMPRPLVVVMLLRVPKSNVARDV